MARARSFGNIRKLPSGKYQARYWHLGKQTVAERTFVAKTDARRWLSTVEADIVRGDWVIPMPLRWDAERPIGRPGANVRLRIIHRVSTHADSS